MKPLIIPDELQEKYGPYHIWFAIRPILKKARLGGYTEDHARILRQLALALELGCRFNFIVDECNRGVEAGE